MTIRLAFKLLALVMLGMALSSCVIVIQPTEIGVVLDIVSGQLETPLMSGTHILPVSKSVTIYPITQQEYTFAVRTDDTSNAIEALTSDGQAIAIDLTVLYRLDPDQINLIHLTWANTYAENFVRPTTRSTVREVTRLYTAESIYSTGRENWGPSIQSDLEPKFAEQGLILTDILVRNVAFGPEFTQAMELTVVAAQLSAYEATVSFLGTANAELATLEARMTANAQTPIPNTTPTP
jgi:prohibitin 1